MAPVAQEVGVISVILCFGRKCKWEESLRLSQEFNLTFRVWITTGWNTPPVILLRFHFRGNALGCIHPPPPLDIEDSVICLNKRTKTSALVWEGKDLSDSRRLGLIIESVELIYSDYLHTKQIETKFLWIFSVGSSQLKENIFCPFRAKQNNHCYPTVNI